MRPIFNTVLTGLVALSFTEYNVQAGVNTDNIKPPVLQSSMGKMGIVGLYEGISQYTYPGQQETVTETYYDSILAQVDNTQFLNQGTANGHISNFCNINETVYMTGNFTKIGDLETQGGFASFNTASGNITALENNLNGTIFTLHCDSAQNILYAGGNFTFDDQTGAAVYSPKDKSWSAPLFGGFPNGSSIHAILPFNGNLVFAGSFDGLANDSYTTSDNGDNSTVVNSQRISFTSALVSADGTAPGSDPSSIGRPGSQWVMQDYAVGSWKSLWPYLYTPTVLRMYNLKENGNGINTFRVRSFPNNGIMNLTYINSTTNTEQSCDAWCNLPMSSEQEFVDFKFANIIEMSGIQVEVIDTYGSHGGLSGIELYQDGKFVLNLHVPFFIY